MNTYKPTSGQVFRLSKSDGPWRWPVEFDCPLAFATEDKVFVSGQLPLDEAGTVVAPGKIGPQTRQIFENMKATLAAFGLALSDLVRLNTYYVYDGPEEQATTYWEEMTRVRLEYFPDPGPAATAVRVAGLPVSGCMIQIEGIAHFPDNIANRLRIMPADSWDWSIPVPLSQGWQIGGTVYVGGQISADKKGRAVALGDVGKQTDNVLDFIDRVVEEGGGSPSDIVALKVCYAAGESGEHGRTLLANILQNAQRRLDLTKIALTAFAVDLLYEGLLLEIDAAAEISGAKRALSTGLKPCSDVAGACSGMIAGNQIYLAGRVSAKAPSSTEVSETERVKKQLADILRGFKVDLDQAGSSLPDVAKLNLFIVGDGDTEALMRSLKAISGVITDYFGSKAPAVTIVRVNGLPHADAVIQADCVAIISS